jgi:hypothetical protein
MPFAESSTWEDLLEFVRFYHRRRRHHHHEGDSIQSVINGDK